MPIDTHLRPPSNVFRAISYYCISYASVFSATHSRSDRPRRVLNQVNRVDSNRRMCFVTDTVSSAADAEVSRTLNFSWPHQSMLHVWLASPLLAHYSPFPPPPLPHVSTRPFQAWLPFWCQPQDWESASWQPPSPSVAPAIPPKPSPAPLRGQRGSPGQVVKHREPTPSAGLQALLLLAFLLLCCFIWLCLESGVNVLLSVACFSRHVSVCVVMFTSHLPVTVTVMNALMMMMMMMCRPIAWHLPAHLQWDIVASCMLWGVWNNNWSLVCFVTLTLHYPFFLLFVWLSTLLVNADLRFRLTLTSNLTLLPNISLLKHSKHIYVFKQCSPTTSKTLTWDFNCECVYMCDKTQMSVT